MPLGKPRKGLPDYPLSPLGNRALPTDRLFLDEQREMRERQQPKITNPGVAAETLAQILKANSIDATNTSWQHGNEKAPAIMLIRETYKEHAEAIEQLVNMMLHKNAFVVWSVHEGNSSKGQP